MNSQLYRSTLSPQNLDSADDRARGVLEDAKRRVGMVPNMYAVMANAPELLETYLFGYEKFRAHSGFSPAEQEIVFLTISYENRCDYCMAAHSVLADKQSGVPVAVTDALRSGKPLPDARLDALAVFTRTMLLQRGRPGESDVADFLAAGYSEKQILDVILAIAVKTLSNYSNHIFATPLDPMFQSRAWEAAPAR